jgi:outer membrane protein insertion porin family/translocation and assembly module TamA
VVLATHLKGGITFAPPLRLTGSTSNFIPPEQRFYAGGANDVRGYDRNQLGPVVYVTPTSNLDSTGAVVDEDLVEVAPTGGNTLVVGNVELRFPSPFLADRLRWALFVDGGGVWERGGGTGSEALFRVTPGFGIRIGTALGPMRLDLAYNRSDLRDGVLFASDTTSALVRVRDDYRKRLTRSFPFNIQISVGQAF